MESQWRPRVARIQASTSLREMLQTQLALRSKKLRQIPGTLWTAEARCTLSVEREVKMEILDDLLCRISEKIDGL
jgi:hypothetical protein